MKKTILALMLAMISMIIGCSSIIVEEHPEKDEVIENKKEINENDILDNKTIDLEFTPVEKYILKEGLPNDSWVKGKSIYFGNLPGQIESTLHLYIDNSEYPELRPGEGTIYGFLEHEGKFYELGIISSYGIDDVNVSLADRTFDGIKEMEIIGAMGSTYIELKVIGLNNASGQWENLLTMGSPIIEDLDGDGIVELTAGSAGILPPYVIIYKWNNNCFEKADIVKDTNSTYATLNSVDGQWIIETGSMNDDSDEHMFYTYKQGKLIIINF